MKSQHISVHIWPEKISYFRKSNNWSVKPCYAQKLPKGVSLNWKRSSANVVNLVTVSSPFFNTSWSWSKIAALVIKQTFTLSQLTGLFSTELNEEIKESINIVKIITEQCQPVHLRPYTFHIHCVKGVCIRSYCGHHFCAFGLNKE